MAGLFDSLTSAARSLSAHQAGIEVAGQNLANVNTVGYTRRSVQLAEIAPADRFSAGRGVEVTGIIGLRDRYLEARVRREQQGASFDRATVESLSTVEAAVGLPGASLDERLTAFFDAYTTFGDNVTSPAGRDGVVQQGRQLGQAFNEMAERLSAARKESNDAVTGAVAEINQLSTHVAELNGRIVTHGGDMETLRDERDVAIARLAELADVTVTDSADGSMNVSIGSGRALVVSDRAFSVTATPTGPLGMTTLSVGDYDVTAEVTGGRVGALLRARDTTIPGYQANLDQLAYDIATNVNALHTAGYDGTGAPAGDFFVAPTSVSGAAAGLQVSAAILADSQLVAGSLTGAVGDNQTARAIAALRDANISGGGQSTPTGAWAEFAYRVGSDMAEAQSSGESRSSVVRQLQQLRAQVSGVSVDEEAAQLLRYQRAYEANARYFTTIVDTLDTLMSMVN